MWIGYLFGIVIFLFSCKKAPIAVPPLEKEIPVVRISGENLKTRIMVNDTEGTNA